MRNVQQKSLNWPHFPENDSIKRSPATVKQPTVEDLLEVLSTTPDDVKI